MNSSEHSSIANLSLPPGAGDGFIRPPPRPPHSATAPPPERRATRNALGLDRPLGHPEYVGGLPRREVAVEHLEQRGRRSGLSRRSATRTSCAFATPLTSPTASAMGARPRRSSRPCVPGGPGPRQSRPSGHLNSHGRAVQHGGVHGGAGGHVRHPSCVHGYGLAGSTGPRSPHRGDRRFATRTRPRSGIRELHHRTGPWATHAILRRSLGGSARPHCDVHARYRSVRENSCR
ncbi:hypothetical protein Caci_5509 [Catenulispora acidiphila DSM 44928]|uniref:Uncharacterized protein n=1 Tax=Catenulispora acidiphila (strain DSM 44928 / JCM 14897 / NBRC 102108 / NRRL B-24433 / ID139908) TaxID=479433 RepID=C7QAP5_CATAD|nr:hypothetical protein Caci_5509 [Catenulispora acidiphila DSM 44928]